MDFAFCARTPARISRPLLATLFGVLSLVGLSMAQAADPVEVPIVYLAVAEEEPPPLSLVEPIITDKGLAGAKLGIADNATTGRFLNHGYELTEAVFPDAAQLAERVEALLAEGQRFFVADLRAEELLALADLPTAADALFLNIRAQDDRLRTEDCRANVLHVAPSRAMKADALAQYLAAKRWNRWFLLAGGRPEDQAFVEALRRAAKRFGGRFVEERTYEYEPTARRTDSGHQQIQSQIAGVTQEAADYDVLVVADESDLFGEYLPYRTWDPRPVVGTQGLVPTAWHRSHEQWGGTQMQTRFLASAGRIMVERDFNGWAAVRSIGEAVTRLNGAEPAAVHEFLIGDEFRLAAFKGEGLTYRRWNQQLRQPMLLAAARALVSVSPQEGFLHERTPLDTLGYDEPETGCQLN